VITTQHQSLKCLSFGWPFELGGRRPFLPNLLTPFWPELRVEWSRSGGTVCEPRQVAADMVRHLRAVRPIGLIATGCASLIVLVACNG
jgi:hypothetical protein